MKKFQAYLLIFCFLLSLQGNAQDGFSVRSFAGMWSDPPPTIEGLFCFLGCTDSGLELLNTMLDDPANDSLALEELMNKAILEDLGNVLEPLLTAFSRPDYPLDQSKRLSFLECQPTGFADQIFQPHQFEITVLDDHIDLHYGEWDAHRTVYMDGRRVPANEPDSIYGYSTGRMEGATLVINTAHIKPDILATVINHSNQLQAEERYTISADRQVLTMYVTLTDPVALTEPFTLKRFWYWAPDEVIDPYVDCEIPTDYIEHLGE